MSTSTTSTTSLTSKPRYIHTIHKLDNDTQTLNAAAHTVGSAFDHDPLVTWLRPGAQTWGHFSSETMKWQRRRLVRARIEGQVVRVSTETVVKENPREMLQKTQSEHDKFGGIAILHPPKSSKKNYSLKIIWEKFFLKVRDLVDPAGDEGSNMERVEQMITSHNQNYAEQAARFPEKPLWYLEVCCTRPTVQGRGVGKRLMEWVVEQTKDGACLLDCTDEKNVAFYQRFGFEVAEVINLSDGDDVLQTWLMIRL